MTTNINEETGIRYGVIDARDCMELYDEICSSGDNLTYEQFKTDTIANLQSALESALDIRSSKSSKLKDISENLFDTLNDEEFFFYEEDCDSYRYTDSSGNTFLLQYLGGAPLIWCIKTNAVVYVNRLCSPCIPNAGDLNSGLCDADSGYQCYGIPEDCFTKDELEAYKKTQIE